MGSCTWNVSLADLLLPLCSSSADVMAYKSRSGASLHGFTSKDQQIPFENLWKHSFVKQLHLRSDLRLSLIWFGRCKFLPLFGRHYLCLCIECAQWRTIVILMVKYRKNATVKNPKSFRTTVYAVNNYDRSNHTFNEIVQ